MEDPVAFLMNNGVTTEEITWFRDHRDFDVVTLASAVEANISRGFTVDQMMRESGARKDPADEDADADGKPKRKGKKKSFEPETGDFLHDLGFYTIDQLTEEEKKPPEFIVSGMIPVGLTFITGAPKIRKSFFALQMAAAVASGNPFLGHATTQCSVAYFDLEGSKSRISARTGKMSTALPSNVYVTNRIGVKIADGLTDCIKGLHAQHPEIRMYIIDTYSRARGRIRSDGSNAYDQDVTTLEPVQQMALDENIALVFVHHDKKGAGFQTDALERASGTMGITGSADSVLTMSIEGKRFEGKAKLEYNPRDALGGEMQLEFDGMCCEWHEATMREFDLEGNPITAFCIHNVTDKAKDAEFFSYEFVWNQAYKVGVLEGSADKIRNTLTEQREDLFRKYGIVAQLGIKYQGKRGIRLMKVF